MLRIETYQVLKTLQVGSRLRSLHFFKHPKSGFQIPQPFFTKKYNMKYVLILCLAFANLLNAATPDSIIVDAPKFSFKKKVTLVAGTLILMETDTDINSTNLTEEQLLKFTVTDEVYANRRVVIAAGATAIGKVKTITPASFNDPECITIEVTNVQTVDGQMITLAGFEQCIKGKFAGQGVKVDAGTSVMATNLEDVEIHWK